MIPQEKENKNTGIPFIVTYHPHVKHLDKLIHQPSTSSTSNIYMRMSKLDLSLHLHFLLKDRRTLINVEGPRFALINFVRLLDNCLCVCVSVCMCVCVCMFISFHRKSFSRLNKTINVMPEIRPAMLCWGNHFLSSTFIATS